MEAPKRAFSLRIEGRVQRLGYRRFILEAAQELGIEGLVTNEPDGSLRVFAQGEEGRLKEFLAKIRAPPSPIAVRGLEETPPPPDPGIKHFQTAFGSLAEELQEGFGAMQNEFRDYRDEFGDYRQEFRGFVGEFRDYRQEFRAFTERTDESFKALDQKYGEISAKLSLLLETFQKESLETRKELTRAVDTLSDLVKQFVESRQGKAQPAGKGPQTP